MSKQLVLVADSVYGPGGAGVVLLFTDKEDLASLIRELDVLRTAKRNDEREAWTMETIEEYINKGTIVKDDWWCLIENPSFTLRLDGFERKWWAVGLGNHQRALEEYCVVMTHPDADAWVDLVSLENGSVQEAITNATRKAMEIVPLEQWDECHAALAFPLAVKFELGYNIEEGGSVSFCNQDADIEALVRDTLLEFGEEE